ncbi:MAG: twin-arginine translocase subunit TatC [Stomatobaculum sp.]|nr:twin-arginine translocase subunit TatC [Stomatobaculum sp.]
MTGLIPFLRRFRTVCFFFAAVFLLLLTGGYLLSPAILQALSGLLPGERLYQLSVAEGLVTRLEIGVCISAVITLLLIFSFVLLRIRKKSLWLVPVAALLFLFGAGFCFAFLLPSALRLLTGLLPYELRLSVENYVSFCLVMLLLIGLLFEEPLVMYLLYKLGLLQVSFLTENRKRVFLAALIILAVLTPSGDAVTLCVAMLPFILLYELAVFWLTVLDRKKEKEAA